jgi:3-methyladenine DNA glycosylase AlkD
MNAAAVQRALATVADTKRAESSAWFFKTAKGQYGHGDVFIGVTVPQQRSIAQRHTELPFAEITTLLQSKIHEHRLTALLILVARYTRGDTQERARIARFYMKERRFVNNWDLVDASAPYILGEHLRTHDRAVLYRYAHSRSLWDRRIAIIATFTFIRNGEYTDTLKIAEVLLADTHDLIHKAVGWMLREIGKRSKETLCGFLRLHAGTMPRTMLRYAIEKFPESERARWMRITPPRVRRQTTRSSAL